MGHTHSEIYGDYSDLLEKAENILASWINRNLSLFGKILVINTLVASLFIYRMSTLPLMDTRVCSKLDSIFTHFLWDGKKPKISLRVLKMSKKKGGAGLVHVQKRDKAIKISWVKILIEDNKMANLAYAFFSPVLQHDIWRCNLKAEHVSGVFVMPNPFWSDMLHSWCQYNYSADPRTASRFIWLNSLILVDCRPIMWNDCYQKGLKYVHQIFANGTIIGVKAAMELFGLDIMRYNTLISALPKIWLQECKNNCRIEDSILYITTVSCNKPAQKVYRDLNNQTDICAETGKKWSGELKMDVQDIDFEKLYRNIYVVTNNIKLRSFQYRFLHKALVLNIHLFHWGILDNNLCTFCGRHRETVTHLFWECTHVKQLWTDLSKLSEQYLTVPVRTRQVDWVFFTQPNVRASHLSNMFCLITRQYIYRVRCQKQLPCISQLKLEIFRMENVERYIATKNNKLHLHNRKWPSKLI